MKYSIVFYFIYLLLIPIDLLGLYDLNIIFLVASITGITILCIVFFKIQQNHASKKIDIFVLSTLICLALCEAIGLFRDNPIYFSLAFIFALIAAVSGFIFLDYRSNWRKKAFSNRNVLYVVPTLLFFFFISDKLVLSHIPNLAFFPASFTVITFVFIFVIAFFRETNKESFYFIIIACFCFFLALIISSNTSLKPQPHSLVLITYRLFYLVAKFFWTLGCTWALKATESPLSSKQNQQFMR